MFYSSITASYDDRVHYSNSIASRLMSIAHIESEFDGEKTGSKHRPLLICSLGVKKTAPRAERGKKRCEELSASQMTNVLLKLQ